MLPCHRGVSRVHHQMRTAAAHTALTSSTTTWRLPESSLGERWKGECTRKDVRVMAEDIVVEEDIDSIGRADDEVFNGS